MCFNREGRGMIGDIYHSIIQSIIVEETVAFSLITIINVKKNALSDRKMCSQIFVV